MKLSLCVVSLAAACNAFARQTPPAAPPPAAAAPTAAPIASGQAVTELDERIFHIFQAKDSAYWFGSDGQGVYRYDGKALVRFTTEQGLGGNHIRGIQEDREGNIYVCSDPGGVSRFDGRGFSRLTVADASEWKLGPDDLWFPGGQDSGAVYRWDGTALHRLAFPRTEAGDAHNAAWPRSKYPNINYSPYDVYTIFKDSKERLWFGTATLGACRYDGSTFEWAGTGENGSFGVRSIVEDKEGKFWLSNTKSRFAEEPAPPAPGEAGAPRYRKEPGMATDADDFSVFMSAARDKNGDLWLATLGAGVFRYEGTKMTHFPVTHEGKPIWVYSIYRDRQGALWLGTHEHGVYRFDGRAFEGVRF